MDHFQKYSIGYIKLQRNIIDQSHFLIIEWANKNIRDFHWLDYKVSTFWECEASPIGMCVFHLNDYGRATHCRYCQGPEERK